MNTSSSWPTFTVSQSYPPRCSGGIYHLWRFGNSSTLGWYWYCAACGQVRP